VIQARGVYHCLRNAAVQSGTKLHVYVRLLEKSFRRLAVAKPDSRRRQLQWITATSNPQWSCAGQRAPHPGAPAYCREVEHSQRSGSDSGSAIRNQRGQIIGGLIVPPIGNGYLSPGQTSQLIDTLTEYNEGTIGPGHCDD